MNQAAAPFSSPSYPVPSKVMLREMFVGKQLEQTPTPAVVLDLAVVERNCTQMLETCKALEVDFRPHMKTHKTLEAAPLQVGKASDKVHLVVSTMAEAELYVPYLSSCKAEGKSINVLYGIPLPPSQINRLCQLAKTLGGKNVSVMIDSPDQLEHTRRYKEQVGTALQLFIKVDTGYGRAGIKFNSPAFERLASEIFELEKESVVEMVGLYSHAGHSYSHETEEASLQTLIHEMEELERAAGRAAELLGPGHPPKKLILSVGATPTTTSIQSFLTDPKATSEGVRKHLKYLSESAIPRIQKHHILELHAGNHSFLDMQQIATQASPSASSPSSNPTAISLSDIAMTVLAEVVSTYPDRDPPEALIAAGTLALGREPAPNYSGWGIVGDWGMPEPATSGLKPMRSGWQVGGISQEHGKLTIDPKAHEDALGGRRHELKVGQKVRIFPNHACIAGAMFGWFLVVDSRLKGRGDEIVDVWVRCRGW